MPIRRAFYCLGALPAFLLITDPTDEAWAPLWCANTANIVASLEKQSFVSRRRAEIRGQTHEWFVGPREVIVLQHNVDGTSCIAAESEWQPPIQATP
jgi:hypothetical protein